MLTFILSPFVFFFQVLISLCALGLVVGTLYAVLAGFMGLSIGYTPKK